MLLMLDRGAKDIAKRSEKFGYAFGQLRTPLTGYPRAGVVYGVDNGAFSRFKEAKWRQIAEQAVGDDLCRFVAMPDIVGDAARTLELFEHFLPTMPDGLPLALVLQDGIGSHRIPWDKIAAVFVGGSDAFKIAPEAVACCKAARMMGKWVHVGRVNTFARARQWAELADSCDGSGISQYDHMIADVLAAVRESQSPTQMELA